MNPQYIFLGEKSLAILLETVKNRFDLSVQIMAGGGDNHNLSRAQMLLDRLENLEGFDDNLKVVIDLNLYAIKQIHSFQNANPNNLIILDADEQEDLYPQRLIQAYFDNLNVQIRYQREIHGSFKHYLELIELTNFVKLDLALYVGKNISEVEFWEFSNELYELFFGKRNFEVFDDDLEFEKSTCVSVGVFDGVHLGHQYILELIKQKSRELGLQSVIITFDPHPRTVLESQNIDLILTLNQRVQKILDSGIDRVIVIHFTEKFSKIDTEVFVHKILIDQFKMSELIIGFNNALGNGKHGDKELLMELSSKLGFGLTIGKPQTYNGVTISSSLLRSQNQ
jgi:FAD synthetase